MFPGANIRRDRQAVSLILGQDPVGVTDRKMTSGYDTPPGGQSSWVDLTREAGGATPPAPPTPPGRNTPVAMAQDQDYIRVLKEAQKEFSARSSARVSPINSAMMSVSSTCKNTPSASPKSPPNSPNVELSDFKEFKEQLRLQGVFINREPEPCIDDIISLADWRSRPNMFPPRSWIAAQASKKSSGNNSDAGAKKKELDRKLFLALIASNAISLALGVAVGYWVYRRSVSADLPSLSD